MSKIPTVSHNGAASPDDAAATPPAAPGPSRRRLLATFGVAGAGLAAGARPIPVRAQGKPESIVVVGLLVDWRSTLLELAPVFEKQTGIKVEFTFLPLDALAARLKAQLSTGAGGIDVAQFSADYGWIGPNMADHNQLAQQVGMTDAEWGWNDIFASSKAAFTVDGRLIAIPYRYGSFILHYQPEVLRQAGIDRPPQTFLELQDAAIAVTKAGAGNRFGLGMYGKEGNSLVAGFLPYLFSSGGRLYDSKSWEILIDKPAAVEALEFYANLSSKYKVVPPEAATWEWDGMTAGGQADRYAMCAMIAPYGTLLNDPKLSKTAGRWAWTKVPGATSPDQSMSQSGGWAFGVPESSKNKQWGAEFIKLVASRQWMLRSAMTGNSPPRTSVMTDPGVVEKLGWAPALAQQPSTPIPAPADPMYQTLEQQLRPHITRVLLGQQTAKQAMEAAAADWQRSLRRANLLK